MDKNANVKNRIIEVTTELIDILCEGVVQIDE